MRSASSFAPGVTSTTPRPSSKSGRSRAEAFEIVGAGGGELHRQVLHLQPVQLRQDRPVGAGVVLLAAHARAGAAAQMHRELDAREAFDHRVRHLDREIGRAIGIVVGLAHVGIDEQAQVRIVDLHDVDADVADERDLAAQRLDAVAHEILALRIRFLRALGVPQPLAEQPRRGQRDLGADVRDALQELRFGRDEARLLRR